MLPWRPRCSTINKLTVGQVKRYLIERGIAHPAGWDWMASLA